MTTKTRLFKSENVLDRNFEAPFNSGLAQDILRAPNLERAFSAKILQIVPVIRSAQTQQVNDLYTENNCGFGPRTSLLPKQPQFRWYGFRQSISTPTYYTLLIFHIPVRFSFVLMTQFLKSSPKQPLIANSLLGIRGANGNLIFTQKTVQRGKRDSVGVFHNDRKSRFTLIMNSHPETTDK
jgi:hypothetical protein